MSKLHIVVEIEKLSFDTLTTYKSMGIYQSNNFGLFDWKGEL